MNMKHEEQTKTWIYLSMKDIERSEYEGVSAKVTKLK